MGKIIESLQNSFEPLSFYEIDPVIDHSRSQSMELRVWAAHQGAMFYKKPSDILQETTKSQLKSISERQ